LRTFLPVGWSWVIKNSVSRRKAWSSSRLVPGYCGSHYHTLAPAWPGSSPQEQCWSTEKTVGHRTLRSPVLLPGFLSPSERQYHASLCSLLPVSSLPLQVARQPSLLLSVCSCWARMLVGPHWAVDINTIIPVLHSSLVPEFLCTMHGKKCLSFYCL
jgi:hypothetical protein